MHFLSEADRKRLMGEILPQTRQAGASEELRGWNWRKPPLKPLYKEPIPMYSVCSKYCPTSRDVYLDRIGRAAPAPNENLILGVALHRVVGAAINSFLEGQLPAFDAWYEETLRSRGVSTIYESIRKKSRTAWNQTIADCERQTRIRSSEQPHASRRSVLATAIPFLAEHRLRAERLGLLGLLHIDCYDYLRGIVFDLKLGWEEDWHRLTPTGHAIVLESVYETPVDIGCVSYLQFQGDNLATKKDLFLINDELRSQWIKERNTKQAIVDQRKEPQIAEKCPPDCIYLEACEGESSTGKRPPRTTRKRTNAHDK